jgi:hypothetical protein
MIAATFIVSDTTLSANLSITHPHMMMRLAQRGACRSTIQLVIEVRDDDASPIRPRK